MDRGPFRMIVVYTVCVNDYDVVKAAPKTPSVEFLLFTDTNKKVPGWKTIKIPTGTTRASRFLKINSHLLDQYLDEKPDLTIYMDACLVLRDGWLENLFKKFDSDLNHYNICRHQKKDTLGSHCKRMTGIIKDKQTQLDISVQFEKYKDDPDVNLDTPVYENCFIIRKNSKITTRINKLWWEEYCITSQRDQLSLPCILNKHNLNKYISDLPFDSRDNNIYSGWCKHKTNRQSMNYTLSNVRKYGKVDMKTAPKKVIHSVKPKVAVCTINIPPGNEVMEFCIPSIRRFADHHGYDYHEITEMDKSYPHASWMRLRFRELQESYHSLLYIDGDVFIKDGAESPIDYYRLDGITALDSANEFARLKELPKQRESAYKIAWEKELNQECPLEFPQDRYINAGVMIIPSICKDFLKDPPYVLNDTNMLEQTYLNCQTLLYKYYKLNLCWNMVHPHVDTKKKLKLVEEGKYEFLHFNIPGEKRMKYFEMFRPLLEDKYVVSY